MVARFQPYGPSHWTALLLLLVAAAWLVWQGRRLRRTPAERPFRRCFALVVLAVDGSFQIYSMLPHVWGLDHSLPFELCDLAWMASIWALWTGDRWAFALSYYWGLTLTLQALLTPHLEQDFPDLIFIMFFASHSLTVLAAVFLTWGLGSRPSWRLLGFTILATIAWGTLMLLFNHFAGTNYLYVSHKPPTRSLLDLMGPWPWYLVVEICLGVIVWSTITLPWYARK